MATYNKAAFQNTRLSTPVVEDDLKRKLAMEVAKSKAKGTNPADISPAFGGGRQETTPQDTEKKEEPLPASIPTVAAKQQTRGRTTNQAALDRAMQAVSTGKDKDLLNIDTSMMKTFGGSYGAGSGQAQAAVTGGRTLDTIQAVDKKVTEGLTGQLGPTNYNRGGTVGGRNVITDLGPGFGLGTTLPGSKVFDPTTLPPRLPGAPDEPDDLQDLTEAAIRDLLTGAGVDTEAEKEARRQQAAVDEAKKIQALRAKTGLGGMGLTGAAGALEAQIRAEGTRARDITEAELDRAAREEALRRLQVGIGAGQAERGMGIKEEVYGIERDLYEKELDRDIDGDGTVAGVSVSDTVGDGNPDNNPDVVAAQKAKDDEDRIDPSQKTAERLMEEEYGKNLDDISEGDLADKASAWNRYITTYTDEYGRKVEIFQVYDFWGVPRDPPAYFKKTEGA